MSRKKQTTVTIPANKIGQESRSERSAELNLEASLGESRPLSADVIEFRVFGYAHNDITDPPGWTPPFDVDTSTPGYWVVGLDPPVLGCGHSITDKDLPIELKCSLIRHYRISEDKEDPKNYPQKEQTKRKTYAEPVTIYLVRRKYRCPICKNHNRVWEDCSTLVENGAKMSRQLERLLAEKVFCTEITSLANAYGVSKSTLQRLHRQETARRTYSRTWNMPAVLGIYTIEFDKVKWALCINWDNRTLLDIVDLHQQDDDLSAFTARLNRTENSQLILVSADDDVATYKQTFPPDAVPGEVAIEKEDVLHRLRELVCDGYYTAVKNGIPRRQLLKAALLGEDDSREGQELLQGALGLSPGLSLVYEYFRTAKQFYGVSADAAAFYREWWRKADDEWLPKSQNDKLLDVEFLHRARSFVYTLHNAQDSLAAYLNVHLQQPHLFPTEEQVQRLLQCTRTPLAQYVVDRKGRITGKTSQKSGRGITPETLRANLLYGLPQRITWLNAEERKEATMAFCAPGQTPRRFYYDPAHPEIPLEYFLYTLPLFLNELAEGVDYRMPLPYETPEMTEL